MKNLILAVLFCFGAFLTTSVTGSAATHELNEVVPGTTPIDYGYNVAMEVNTSPEVAFTIQKSAENSSVDVPAMVHYAHHSKELLLQDVPKRAYSNPFPTHLKNMTRAYYGVLRGPPRLIQHKS